MWELSSSRILKQDRLRLRKERCRHYWFTQKAQLPTDLTSLSSKRVPLCRWGRSSPTSQPSNVWRILDLCMVMPFPFLTTLLCSFRLVSRFSLFRSCPSSSQTSISGRTTGKKAKKRNGNATQESCAKSWLKSAASKRLNCRQRTK